MTRSNQHKILQGTVIVQLQDGYMKHFLSFSFTWLTCWQVKCNTVWTVNK